MLTVSRGVASKLHLHFWQCNMLLSVCAVYLLVKCILRFLTYPITRNLEFGANSRHVHEDFNSIKCKLSQLCYHRPLYFTMLQFRITVSLYLVCILLVYFNFTTCLHCGYMLNCVILLPPKEIE